MALSVSFPRSHSGNPSNRTLVVAVALSACVLLLTAALLAAATTNYVRTGDGIGGDFLTDYAGGHMIRVGDGPFLYDITAQEQAQREVSTATGDEGVNPYVATPTVAWAFVPISALPYGTAHILFTIANIAALVGAVLLLRRELAEVPARLRYALLFAFAFSMPAITNIAWGQIDLILVFGTLLGWRCLRSDREVFAGAAFSLILLKPHFAIGIILLMAVQRRWLTLGTMAAIGVPLLAVPGLLLGPAALADYAKLVTGMTELPAYIDTQPQHMANWRGFTTGLTGRDAPAYWAPITVVTGVAALAIAWREWRRDASSARSFALALLLPLLMSPHVHMQSMMILFVATALVVGHDGARAVALPKGLVVDGPSGALLLLVALFTGWFLTANDISVMVFVTLAVFGWCAFAEDEKATAHEVELPLAA